MIHGYKDFSKIITGKDLIQWEQCFELAPSKVTQEHMYKLFKKWKGTLGQKFFSGRLMGGVE